MAKYKFNPGIIAADSLTDILLFVQSEFVTGDMVVFDIDEVLITERLDPFYFEHFKVESDLYKEFNLLDSEQKDLFFFFLLVTQSPQNIQLMDISIPELMLNLQNEGVICVANTAMPSSFMKCGRQFNFAEARKRLLSEFGFNFSVPEFSIDLSDILEDLLDRNFATNPIWDSGVLFSSKASKSTTQMALLRCMSNVPRKFLFVDDNIENVRQMFGDISEMGIECYCIHYTKSQHVTWEDYFSVEDYNRELGKQEFFLRDLIGGGEVNSYFSEYEDLQ